jgi:energy-converting hydrogenase Eha subunit A
MSEEVTPDPAKEARKATRRHRILALTIGVPLAAVLVVPWERWDWVFLWDLPDGTKLPLAAAGLAGLLFVRAAFAAEERRRRALALAGVAAGAAGLWLLGAIPFSGSQLRRVGLMATRAWVLVAMWAVGAEMAMHRRPESRAISVGAFLGWLGILALFFFVPVGAELDPEGTAAAQLLARLDDRWHRMPFVVPFYGWFAFIAFFGLVQTLVRLGEDRARAAQKPFRRSWLAWALYPAPLIALFAFGAFMVATNNDADELTNVFLAFGLVYGCSLGGAVGIRSLLLREREAVAPIPKRALIGVGAALAIALAAFGLYRIFASASDEGAMEGVGWEVAEAVGQAIRGEPFDRRFLGGYSELDLRNAAGVVELPEGAEPAVALFDVSWSYESPRTLVLRRDAPAAWVTRQRITGRSGDSGPIEALEKADPGFAAMVETLLSAGCRPSLPEDALDDPAVAAAFLQPPSLEPVCPSLVADGDAPRVETLAGQGRVGRRLVASVPRYVIVFTVPGGDPVAVTGAIRAGSGLAWVGNPTPLTGD